MGHEIVAQVVGVTMMLDMMMMCINNFVVFITEKVLDPSHDREVRVEPTHHTLLLHWLRRVIWHVRRVSPCSILIISRNIVSRCKVEPSRLPNTTCCVHATYSADRVPLCSFDRIAVASLREHLPLKLLPALPLFSQLVPVFALQCVCILVKLIWLSLCVL